MTDAESYGLGLLTEEAGEVLQLIGLTGHIGRMLQVIGKAERFGLDTPGVKDPLTGAVDMSVTPRTRLASELGDLLAAVDYITMRRIVPFDVVHAQRRHKLVKLLDPDSKDNLGRRLAP